MSESVYRAFGYLAGIFLLVFFYMFGSFMYNEFTVVGKAEDMVCLNKQYIKDSHYLFYVLKKVW